MSKTVFRYDRGGALRSPVTTPHGFLRAQGHAARTGIYKYRRADGSIQRELRPREEVMHPDSLASYASAPVTLEHPADEEVTAENVRRHEVGHVEGPARADGDAVATDTLIKDAKAIKAVKAGKQELSPGYKIRIDETPGFAPEYADAENPTGRYDAVQRDIRVNHLAIVDRARGGSAMRLRMDAAEEVLSAARPPPPAALVARYHLPGSMFAVPRHDGLPIDTAENLLSAIARFHHERWADSSQEKTAYHQILNRATALRVDASSFRDTHGARLDTGGKLTTITAGHQHLVDTCGWDGQQLYSGETSASMSEGADCAHSHPWTMGMDGAIMIGEAAGHLHAVIDAASAPAPAGYFVPTATSNT